MIHTLSIMHLIGRKLSDQEIKVLSWLNGWEDETSDTVALLIQDAYKNGQKREVEATTTIMTETEIHEFAEALAVRFMQVSESRVKTDSESKLYRLFQDVIKTLPSVIATPFWAACNRIMDREG